jgi:hypothetical protein
MDNKIITSCSNIRIASRICIILAIVVCNCNPIHKVQKLIRQNKCELALSFMDKEIKNNPDASDTFARICLWEGAQLLKKDDFSNANMIFKYAINVLQAHNLQLPLDNFRYYVSNLNNKDTLFNLIGYTVKALPESYKPIAYILIQLNYPDITIVPGYLEQFFINSWIYPSNSTPELCEKLFGFSTFNPETSYTLTEELSLSEITSINKEALDESIAKNQLFLTSCITTGLSLNLVPELYNEFADLRGKTEFQIASEKGRIINKIIQTREKYLIPNLKYIFTTFEIPGKCIAYKNEYNFDQQEISLHLSVIKTNSTVSVAIIRIPLSLADAEALFTSDIVEGKVNFKVSTGIGVKLFGIVNPYTMPNLYLKSNPIIVFEDGLKSKIQFTSDSLKGELWAPRTNSIDWDSQENVRIVIGRKL